MTLARKILTRPIHWYERHRKYPILPKIFQMPVRPVNPASDAVLAILTTTQMYCETAWTAYSLLKWLPETVGLHIYSDGNFSSEEQKLLNALFPGVWIENVHRITETLKDMPNASHYASLHPMGRKLGVILSLQQKYDVLYCDSDILCFADIPEVVPALSGSRNGRYLQEEKDLNADALVLEAARKLHVNYAPTLNAGYLAIPRLSLPCLLAEQLLQEGYDVKSWFSEQTIMAALMQQAEATPLPRDRYVLTNRRQFYFEKDIDYHHIALRHFTGPVRHLMYLHGMPYLWKQWRGS